MVLNTLVGHLQLIVAAFFKFVFMILARNVNGDKSCLLRLSGWSQAAIGTSSIFVLYPLHDILDLDLIIGEVLENLIELLILDK